MCFVRMSFSLFASRSRLFSITGALVLLCTTFGVTPASGQYWHQTVRIATPVEQGALRALLDTLVHRIEGTDRGVRRTAHSTDRMSLSALRSRLIAKHGIGITTANTVLVKYDFRIKFGDHLERTIQSLEFQLRYPPLGPYIRILRVDARQPWVQDLLAERSPPPLTNKAATILFRQRLQFSRLIRRDSTRIVEIGGNVIRSDFTTRKASFVRKIEQLTYGGLMSVAEPGAE